MSKLRGLKRNISKGKSRVTLKMKKEIKVKNGYLKITFPLTAGQIEVLNLFTDYLMSFVYGDRNLNNTKDAEEWKEKVKLYMDGLFGENSYYQCFGDTVATHEEIGELFEQFNNLIRECREEVKQFMELVTECKKKIR